MAGANERLVKAGWLSKEGDGGIKWYRRFFVLTSAPTAGVLHCYLDQAPRAPSPSPRPTRPPHPQRRFTVAFPRPVPNHRARLLNHRARLHTHRARLLSP